jgi:hypothetical protein
MLPPHADELRRLDPRHVAQLVRLVQVQFQVRHVQAGRAVGDAQRAPRRREGAVAHDGRADADGASCARSFWPSTLRSHIDA